MKVLLAALAIVLAGCGSAAYHPSPPPPPSSTVPAVPVTGLPASIPGLPSPAYTWPPSATCGRERWPVKVGTDPTAKLISPVIHRTTVAHLDSLIAPQVLPQDARATTAETEIFRVHATLVAFKLEPDSDYHLILRSGGKTMIAEIPDPPCAKGSPLLGGIETARSEFDARFTPSPDHFTDVSVPVTVTGVGFFDFEHGQDGVAPNAIELHPVLSITFGG